MDPNGVMSDAVHHYVYPVMHTEQPFLLFSFPSLGDSSWVLWPDSVRSAFADTGSPKRLRPSCFGGAKVEPKLAVLKPVSAAIAIGSGGPFGAEGPIILTGGAVGSLIAQFFHLSSAERKTLLVAGAAAGMSATFCSASLSRICLQWNCCCSSGSPAA